MPFLPMAKTIIQSLFRKEATVPYPMEPMPKDPLVRGHVDIDIDACIFCGICGKKCPTGALRIDRNDKEWEIARFECIVCGACCEACPKKCLHMRPELTPSAAETNKDLVKAGA